MSNFCRAFEKKKKTKNRAGKRNNVTKDQTGMKIHLQITQPSTYRRKNSN